MAIIETTVGELLRQARCHNLISEREKDEIAIRTLEAAVNEDDLLRKRVKALKDKGIGMAVNNYGNGTLTTDRPVLMACSKKPKPLARKTQYKSIW